MNAVTDMLDLRTATPADQPVLAALFRATRDDLAQLGEDAAIVELIAMQRRIHAEGLRLRYPNARQWLLHEDGHCVAQLVIDCSTQRLYLVDIAVLPAARRQGRGLALLQWAQQQALAAGVPLALQVQRHNEAAWQLYLSAGFVADAADGVFVQMHWQPA